MKLLEFHGDSLRFTLLPPRKVNTGEQKSSLSGATPSFIFTIPVFALQAGTLLSPLRFPCGATLIHYGNSVFIRDDPQLLKISLLSEYVAAIGSFICISNKQ
ncbi:hypothetical protein TELCIR_05085 [Teladorsagia circumcincta]|uniref:Uncharacterized protein n=1 Tax=Teladorsagia circumcincta TaxID=45464 RepID=A0A2G9US33_TELCI|nr:hypothetical protein TELCIR_05085 [Teladorsagia circumcincta]